MTKLIDQLFPDRRYYGWRGRGVPDQRDLLYSAPLEELLNLPASVDLTTPSLGPPFDPDFDQGSLGSCGPNTAAALLTYLMTTTFGKGIIPSRLFIYYTTRLLMGTISSDSGVDNSTLMKALYQYGWCDETLWPYNISQFTMKPSQACFDQAAKRKITQYLSVPQQIAQMKASIAAKQPWVLGFTVYDSFESDAVTETGEVPMPKGSESTLGGHDVLAVGYSDETARIKFRNPWGEQWGRKGYGTMPYGYVTSPSLSGDFWTIKGTGWAPDGPTPPIPPPPSPTPLNAILHLTYSRDVAVGNPIANVPSPVRIPKGRYGLVPDPAMGDVFDPIAEGESY